MRRLGLTSKRLRALTKKDAEQYAICLRGKVGWGENVAFLTAMSNSF